MLQIFLASHQWYLYLFVLVTLLLFVYKGDDPLVPVRLFSLSLLLKIELTTGISGIMLPYPPTGAYTWDLVFLVLYLVIENTRLFQGAFVSCLPGF